MESWEEYKDTYTNKIDTTGYTCIDVACPKCGKPIYKNTFMVLASYPPQYEYKCFECGWIGYARH